MSPVRAAVAAALARASGPVYVGFSGGLDSTVLLHAVAAERRHRVVAVHVDHGLHPDSASWSRHCEALAAELGVEFIIRRVEVAARGSLEAAARAARYRVFAGLLDDRNSCLLLAHHRDDQAETVLLRLLQGRGLYGMPAVRGLGAARLERPLLALPRRMLQDYAADRGLRWIDDPANLDERMDRNFLRQRVLPALRQRWPAVEDALLEALEQRRAGDALAARALGDAPGARSLPVALLGEGETAAVRLRLWLQRCGAPLPTSSARAEFLRQLLTAGPDRTPRLALEDGRSLRRHGQTVYLVSAPPVLADCYPMAIPGCLTLPHGELKVAPAGAGFAPVAAVTVRFRQGGERLRCRGRDRSVKQLLQAAGVPAWERDTLPLLYDDRGLLAVPGIASRDPTLAERGSTDRFFRAEWRPR